MKSTVSLVLALSLAIVVTFAAFADSNTVYSDTTVMVYGPLNAYAPVSDTVAWGNPVPAVVTWQHPSWPTLDPAAWISNSYYIEGNISGDTWRLFRKTVSLCEGAYDISGTIDANADNAEEVYVNGVLVGSDGEVQGPSVDNQEWSTFNSYPYTATGDTLTFDFIVRNYGGGNSPTNNPTGLIFSASIEYSCPIQVQVDIKPGSDPSCFNNDGNGVIPAAILGSATFDVSQVDVATVSMEGLKVAVKGKNAKYLASYEDVNLDGYPDLVVKFADVDGVFAKGSGFATITGNLKDGTPFMGTGDICVTQ
jgi:hypothetical protein